MDTVYRLIAFLFCLISFNASAAFAPVQSWLAMGAGYSARDTSPVASCRGLAAKLGISGSVSVQALNTQGTFYNCLAPDFFGNTSLEGAGSCPSGSTLVSGSCVCNTGLVEEDGRCVTPDPNKVCASLGDLGSSSSKWVYKGDSLSTCRGDCVFIPESSGYDKVSGYTIAWGKLINQGLACGATADTESKGYSDSDPDKPIDAPHAGEKGYCPGTYNGATIWVKCSSTNETTKTDNTTTKTETSGGTSSTGTTTTSTTSKTSCDGSNCTTTTTTTTTNPDGTKTDKSETTSQAQADYCTRNPNATACKKAEGSFGGSCSAGFTCEGDAVQCAIAREAYRRNCELLEKETPESTLGKNIANGDDRPVGHPGNSPDIVNVSGNINQTNPYGGSCPPDINLNVYGKTVIVPLSNACDIFKWMGYIAVAFTMYAAARITMSGIST